MKRDTTSDLERVLGTAICSCRHITFTQVALKVGRIRRIFRVYPNQQAVERPDGMHHTERGFLMAIIRWDLAGHYKIQRAAWLRRRRRRAHSQACRQKRSCRYRNDKFSLTFFHFLLSSLLFNSVELITSMKTCRLHHCC